MELEEKKCDVAQAVDVTVFDSVKHHAEMLYKICTEVKSISEFIVEGSSNGEFSDDVKTPNCMVDDLRLQSIVLDNIYDKLKFISNKLGVQK